MKFIVVILSYLFLFSAYASEISNSQGSTNRNVPNLVSDFEINSSTDDILTDSTPSPPRRSIRTRPILNRVRRIKNDARVPSLSSDLETSSSAEDYLIFVQDFRERNGSGNILLRCLIENCTVAQFREAHQQGANIHWRFPQSRQSLLHAAVSLRRSDISRYLIESGLDVDTRDFSDFTPLMYAVQNRHLDMVESLVENGANPLLGDSVGRNCLYLSIQENSPPIFHYLISKGARLNFLEIQLILTRILVQEPSPDSLLSDPDAFIYLLQNDSFWETLHSYSQSGMASDLLPRFVNRLLYLSDPETNPKIHAVYQVLFDQQERGQLVFGQEYFSLIVETFEASATEQLASRLEDRFGLSLRLWRTLN